MQGSIVYCSFVQEAVYKNKHDHGMASPDKGRRSTLHKNFWDKDGAACLRVEMGKPCLFPELSGGCLAGAQLAQGSEGQLEDAVQRLVPEGDGHFAVLSQRAPRDGLVELGHQHVQNLQAQEVVLLRRGPSSGVTALTYASCASSERDSSLFRATFGVAMFGFKMFAGGIDSLLILQMCPYPGKSWRPQLFPGTGHHQTSRSCLCDTAAALGWSSQTTLLWQHGCRTS